MTTGWCNKPGLQLERFPPPAGLEPGTARSAGQRLTEDTWGRIDVDASTSIRPHVPAENLSQQAQDVMTSRRHFDIMCPLGLSFQATNCIEKVKINCIKWRPWSGCSDLGCSIALQQHIKHYPAGKWRRNGVILTSVRRNHVAQTSVRRHFGVVCLLDNSLTLNVTNSRALPKQIPNLISHYKFSCFLLFCNQL